MVNVDVGFSPILVHGTSSDELNKELSFNSGHLRLTSRSVTRSGVSIDDQLMWYSCE